MDLPPLAVELIRGAISGDGLEPNGRAVGVGPSVFDRLARRSADSPSPDHGVAPRRTEFPGGAARAPVLGCPGGALASAAQLLVSRVAAAFQVATTV